jgi:hypothetical protein
VHYASTVVVNPKLEWGGWLGRCEHQINGGGVCGRFLLKEAVRGPKLTDVRSTNMTGVRKCRPNGTNERRRERLG